MDKSNEQTPAETSDQQQKVMDVQPPDPANNIESSSTPAETNLNGQEDTIRINSQTGEMSNDAGTRPAQVQPENSPETASTAPTTVSDATSAAATEPQTEPPGEQSNTDNQQESGPDAVADSLNSQKDIESKNPASSNEDQANSETQQQPLPEKSVATKKVNSNRASSGPAKTIIVIVVVATLLAGLAVTAYVTTNANDGSPNSANTGDTVLTEDSLDKSEQDNLPADPGEAAQEVISDIDSLGTFDEEADYNQGDLSNENLEL